MKTYARNFDPTKADQGGLPKPGKCQLLVVDVDEQPEKNRVSFTCTILAHEVESQVGKTTYVSVNLDDAGAKRAFAFAYATGIYTRQQAAADHANGEPSDIPYPDADGKVFFSTLVAGEYQGKATCRVEFEFLHLESPDADGHPCSPQYTPKRRAEKKAEDKPAAGKKAKTKVSDVPAPKDEPKVTTQANNVDDVPF